MLRIGIVSPCTRRRLDDALEIPCAQPSLKQVPEHRLEEPSHIRVPTAMLADDETDGVVARPRQAELLSREADQAPRLRNGRARIVQSNGSCTQSSIESR